MTSQTVVRFLDSIRDRKGANAASNKTWNNTRGALLTFFGWTTKKPQQFTAHNIVADIEPKAKEDKDIQIVTATQVSSLMGHVSTLKDGRYARFFALATFAGIRPDGELGKLEERDIDLENGVIKIRKEVSKVKKSRQITIQPNLRSWLTQYATQPLNDIPAHEYKRIKKQFVPGHDILRHTFCSNHLHVGGTFAETAMEAGNSEAILRSNYVNRTTKSEADKFWAIVP